ncbi:MAG: PfkB family carbohydrate kinase [Ardenticatenaceae bacterium]|nr:PfkB family carbohydrate kinase [Ardenticatenaceae bacterium]HBY93523.1 hypothetical protein [Chloroflexota bacterium]
MAELYTLGNFTIDDIVLHDGRTWIDQAGGNVLYSALGAKIWLSEVGIIARIGNDLPERYLDMLATFDLELVLTHLPRPNLHDWALYEPDGSRQFINHRRSGDNDEMSIRAAEILPVQRTGQAYHIAPMPTLRQRELVHALKRPDNLVALDPHELFLEGFENLLWETLRHVDFFLPSREEARRLIGSDVPERAVKEFARCGPRVTVVKLDTEGSLVYEAAGDRLTHVPIYAAKAVDVTGAGDAYCGGFLAGYLLHGDPVEAACHGTVSASYVVESLGALHVRRPSRGEAEARVASVRERTTAMTAFTPKTERVQ